MPDPTAPALWQHLVQWQPATAAALAQHARSLPDDWPMRIFGVGRPDAALLLPPGATGEQFPDRAPEIAPYDEIATLDNCPACEEAEGNCRFHEGYAAGHHEQAEALREAVKACPSIGLRDFLRWQADVAEAEDRGEEPPALPAPGSSAGVAPATDQTSPSCRAGLRDEIAAALYAHDHPGWRVPLHEADVEPVYVARAGAVLPVLYREWPWLRAEAEDAASAEPATDRATLRDAIRRAVCEAEGFAWDPDMLEPDEYGEVADAVLAVLPASVDRASVLRDFLWRLEQSAGDAAAEKFLDDNPELRRMAAEAGPADTAGHDGDETQEDPPVEPHPTKADLRHALTVLDRYHGQDATGPEVQAWAGATELASDREIAARAATGLVGYRQGNGSLLHCLAHKPAPASRWADFHEVAAEDLEDGGICVHPRCGRDLLARWPAVEQPAAAQQPSVPPAHYRRDDGVDCCVHTIPVGPDSCPHCRELHDDEQPAAAAQQPKEA